MKKRDDAKRSEMAVLGGYAKTSAKMVGASVLTYVCASGRMREVYRLQLKGFKKEICIALGLRKYTPELKKEFQIQEQITDLIESIDKDCNYKRAINLYLLISMGHKEDKIRLEAEEMLIKVKESIARKKDKLKKLRALYRTQEALANQVQASINKEKRQAIKKK